MFDLNRISTSLLRSIPLFLEIYHLRLILMSCRRGPGQEYLKATLGTLIEELAGNQTLSLETNPARVCSNFGSIYITISITLLCLMNFRWLIVPRSKVLSVLDFAVRFQGMKITH